MGIFKYTNERMTRNFPKKPQDMVSKFLSGYMPTLFQESQYDLGKINKVFASQWLSDRQVVFGTKCNRLIAMDLVTRHMTHIPSLRSSDESLPADCPCGIHSIDINPSQTMLATGAENTNDVAVYKLPTFDPVCVGEQGHDDWIFDLKWLDDEFLVTGSRDSCLVLWQVREDDDNVASCIHQSRIMKQLKVPEYGIKKPTAIKMCKKAEKIRSLAFNRNTQDIAALSLNAYIHLFDAQTFNQKLSRKLLFQRENVCMALCKERDLYAIGSQSNVTFLDPRTSTCTTPKMSNYKGSGIRSITFKDHVVTIGTGSGLVLFFDIRAEKFQDCDCGQTCKLKAGKGYLLHDEMYRDFFMDQDYPNAIYTHSYDDSGTKLFTAGGPLPAGLWGNYAAVWQ